MTLNANSGNHFKWYISINTLFEYPNNPLSFVPLSNQPKDSLKISHVHFQNHRVDGLMTKMIWLR